MQWSHVSKQLINKFSFIPAGMGPRAGGPQQGMNFGLQGPMGAAGIGTSTAGMAGPTAGGDIAADPNVRQAVPGLRDRKIVWTGKRLVCLFGLKLLPVHMEIFSLQLRNTNFQH